MLAEMLGRFMKGKLARCCPQIELISGHAAGEAAEQATLQVYREGLASDRWTGRQRAVAAKLSASNRSWLEVEQRQHLAHRDLGGEAAVVDSWQVPYLEGAGFLARWAR